MGANKAVLIVDDDADIREVEANILRGAGYSVIEAENGKVALNILATREEPCLVLLNVMMPEMTGHQVLDVLRENRRLETLQVVVVSATHAHAPDSNGDVRFLRKPLSMDALLHLVAEFCGPWHRHPSANGDGG